MTYLTSYLDLTYFNRSSFLWSYGIGKLPSLLSSVLRSASKTSSSPVLLAGPFRKSGQRCRKFFFIQRGNREPVWRVPSVGELPPKFWRKSDLFFFFFCFSLFDLKHIRWILVLLLSLNSEKPNVQSHLISLEEELTELVEQLLITCLNIKGLMAAEIMLLFLLM